MQLSDNFSLAEMLYSETANSFKKTAEKPGVSPTVKAIKLQQYNDHYNPPPVIIANLKNLCQYTLQPIAEKCDELFGVDSYIKVRSGYRSKAVNAAIKGSSKTSQHMDGEAADIDLFVDGEERNDLLVIAIKALEHEGKLNFDQLILEYGTPQNPSWVHISYNSNGPQRRAVLSKAQGKPYLPHNLF